MPIPTHQSFYTFSGLSLLSLEANCILRNILSFVENIIFFQRFAFSLLVMLLLLVLPLPRLKLRYAKIVA